MKTTTLVMFFGAMAWGQPSNTPPPPSHQFLKVQQYSAEEDSNLLKLYDGLRVADVIDALDAVGLPEVTMMDKRIRPLWRDEQKITHRIHGIALTVRLVPAQATAREFKSHADERVWETREWGPPAEMRTEGRASYTGLIRPGTILVVDGQAKDNGFCGSNNALTMTGLGLRGLVGNAVCRDTDELTLTRIPVYQDPMEAPRGINQGRMWMESYNQPVVVGGVLVMPGDVIVADNDGVAVVPRRVAGQVAEIAGWIFHDDEIKRGKIYDSIGRPRDWTVLGHKEPPPPTTTPIKR
ncbi:MAG TPA: RraA family protein [Verrucomicrobiae bacterium]|nr:RraA family protein [Verrucomicrobiae bacterium]